jgi:3-hydroxyisobutyrate dehydrogenase
MMGEALGFVGLGLMGVPMARRLVAAGHQVAVWNRTAKADAVPGAMVAGSPVELARQANIIGLCVLDGTAVEAVCFGPGGLAEIGQVGAGKLVVDFSTIGPDRTVALAGRLRAATGMGWVDAPVSGGVPGAEAGSLVVFAGGEAADLDQAAGMLAAVSARVTHMGALGAGQAAKLCNQAIVSVNMLLLAETFAMARRAGVDVTKLAPALQGGFADSTPLRIFGPRMASHIFAPRLGAIQLMAKDLELAQAMAGKVGAATPLGALCNALYRNVHGDPAPGEDISALVRLYERDVG